MSHGRLVNREPFRDPHAAPTSWMCRLIDPRRSRCCSAAWCFFSSRPGSSISAGTSISLPPRSHGTDLRGVPIHLYLYNWPLLSPFAGDRRPRLDLYGTFGNSQLVMEDRSGLARAFRPDGALQGPQDRNQPRKQESAHVTLEEDSCRNETIYRKPGPLGGDVVLADHLLTFGRGTSVFCALYAK